MDFNKVKDYVNNHAEQYLKADNAGKGYICPICNSGSGKNGTGITTKDGIHYTCWAGCFTNADIIDIVGIQWGLDSYKDKVERTATLFGYSDNQHELPAPKPTEPKQKQEQSAGDLEGKQAANKKLIALGKARLRETDYLDKRGITLPFATAFNLGYVPDYRGMGEAIIIPTNMNNGNHIARFIKPTANKYYYAGNRELFNNSILYTAEKPIIITEGELDAISIAVAGGKAIGLGGVQGTKKLLELLKDKLPAMPLVIALDNDEPGNTSAARLMQGLADMGYRNYVKANLYGACKDANEALISSKSVFISTIATINKARTIEELRNAVKQIQYASSSAGNCVAELLADIHKSRTTTPYIPTGFRKLDECLEGGLYEGVHYIGALSSLGKTTFVMQIADNIAKGQIDYNDALQEKFPATDVLIFSLEMSQKQLIAKSISRETFTFCINNKLDTRVYPKTSRGITVGKRYANYSDKEIDVINSSVKAYSDYAKHIYIVEGNGNYSTKNIRQSVQYHIDSTGRKPVVIIDYLQILAPSREKATDKQATDLNVIELKNISKQFGIPILCISSINRDNYSQKISMQAFKESGNIEFSSDVLIGLQLAGAGKKDFDVDVAKAKTPRDIELIILKNREAPVGKTIELDYLPAYNYFREKR